MGICERFIKRKGGGRERDKNLPRSEDGISGGGGAGVIVVFFALVFFTLTREGLSMVNNLN
jgi:hypothetical protein